MIMITPACLVKVLIELVVQTTEEQLHKFGKTRSNEEDSEEMKGYFGFKNSHIQDIYT